MSAKTLYRVRSSELELLIKASDDQKLKDGLDKDKASYDEFSDSWQKVNFDEYLAKLGITDDNWIVTDNKRKIYFEKEGFEFEIVCAISAPYFRIQKTPILTVRGESMEKNMWGLI